MKFKTSRDLTFRNQSTKASLSTMNNIAEGFERGSNQEFKHFLYIAKGSCGEGRSMLYMAFELEYITNDEFKDFIQLSDEILKMISGLIKKL